MEIDSPSSSKNLRCEICSKEFGRLEHLKRHVLTHTKKRLFQCEVCSKEFLRRYVLERLSLAEQVAFNLRKEWLFILIHVVTRTF